MVADCVALIADFNPDVTDLLEISFHEKKEVAFRAAWMLEYIMKHRPAVFAAHMHELLELLPEQKNHSAMRHYAKIIALLTARNAEPIYQSLSESIDFTEVINVLFSWLIDPEMLVATKVHCMQSLANLVPRYKWIKDDLLATVDHLVDLETIAFFARARQIRKQLKKIK